MVERDGLLIRYADKTVSRVRIPPPPPRFLFSHLYSIIVNTTTCVYYIYNISSGFGS